MTEIPTETRLAVYRVWDAKCAYCTEPLRYKNFQVDHIIPENLKGEALRAQIESHGLPKDFAVQSPENFAACCSFDNNNNKGSKPPPNSASITLILRKAADRAAQVRRLAREFKDGANLDRALVRALATARGNPDALREHQDELRKLIEIAEQKRGFRGEVKPTAITYGSGDKQTSRRVVLIDPNSPTLPKVALVLEQSHEPGWAIQNAAESIAEKIRSDFGEYLTVLHYDEGGTWDGIWIPVPIIDESPSFGASWDDCPPGSRETLRQAGFM